MTWSERSELRVSAGAYTVSVRIQTIHETYFVRYTSYELLCYPSKLFIILKYSIISGVQHSCPSSYQTEYAPSIHPVTETSAQVCGIQ